MEPHSGKDVPPSQRDQFDQTVDTLEDVSVVRVDTAFQYDDEIVSTQLAEVFSNQSSFHESNMESGESGEVEVYSDPPANSNTDLFDSVTTTVRRDNYFFLDLITVGTVSDDTRRSILDGDTPAGAPQHALEELLSDLDTINPYYTESTDDLGGLPITSLIVGSPSPLPSIKSEEQGLERDMVQRFVSENSGLLHAINFNQDYPSSVVVPESGPEFLLGNQSMLAPFGPYSAVIFERGNSWHQDPASPASPIFDAIRSLVPMFRLFNWMRHRKQQIADAEHRLLNFDDRLESTQSVSFLKRPLKDLQKTAVYEELLTDFRSDEMTVTRIQQEFDSLGNPYREKSSLSIGVEESFPLSENTPLVQMVDDGAYENLVTYCSEEEPFLRKMVESASDAQQVTRESLFAEISVTSTRQNIRLQYVLIGFTLLLVLLTVILALPILTSF